ncbi:MAG: DUF4160 domain-containing protein [Sphingomonadales bacterium]|nr:DUF4160 domain-containing protein [Sphingomonadales bacterium]
MFHSEHPPAHFHASYQGFEALIAISDGQILAGALPRKAMRIVQDWREAHHDPLMANWQKGMALLPMELIPGADLDD